MVVHFSGHGSGAARPLRVRRAYFNTTRVPDSLSWTQMQSRLSVHSKASRPRDRPDRMKSQKRRLARAKLMRLPAVSTTMKPSLRLPNVACFGDDSCRAK